MRHDCVSASRETFICEHNECGFTGSLEEAIKHVVENQYTVKSDVKVIHFTED